MIIQATVAGLRALYRPKFKFMKAGVMLMGIASPQEVTGSLFSFDMAPSPRSAQLMAVLDLHFAKAEKTWRRREGSPAARGVTALPWGERSGQ